MLFISSLKPSESHFAVIVLPKIVITAKWCLTNYHHVSCLDNKHSPAALGRAQSGAQPGEDNTTVYVCMFMVVSKNAMSI